MALLSRTAMSVAWDRVAVRQVADPQRVPPAIAALTPSWLTAALCGDVPGARVECVSIGDRSAGTSARARLAITYNAAGVAAGLPTTVFAKSSPSLFTRMANGASRTGAAEAGFYRDLRPLLDLRAPRGYYSAVGRLSYRAMHLLEDLVATQQATFCTPTTPINRQQAEQIVETLAILHSSPAMLRIAAQPPPWLRSYRQWWQHNIVLSSIRRYHLKGFRDAADVMPEPLRHLGDRAWAAFVESVVAHDSLPRQVIHGDVHLGNWYVDGNGDMGLCDWQCVVVGNGARDLAYALVTTLGIDDRRAWERDLVALYADRVSGDVTVDHAWDLYRSQLVGALVMWTPTHTPPPMMPAMQPRETSREMIRRITTALDDHETLR